MLVWRLTSARHADTAFAGIGNRRVGSRWVPEGYLAVYTSEHLSLGVLEMLVHMEPRHFGDRFVCIPVDIPEDIPIDHLDVDTLPDDWIGRYEDETLQQVGRDWITAGNSVMLLVPSAVVPQENNIILNPEHPDFAAIQVGEAQPFRFDGRLKPVLVNRHPGICIRGQRKNSERPLLADRGPWRFLSLISLRAKSECLTYIDRGQ